MSSLEMSLSDFRQCISNTDFLEKIIQLREKEGNSRRVKKYNFDFAMACLLGGTSKKNYAVKVYYEKVSETTSFPSSCGQAFSEKLRNIPNELETFFNDSSYEKNSIKKLTEMLSENGEIDKVLGENKLKDRSGILECIEKIMGNNNEVDLLNEQTTRLINSDVKQIVLTGAPGTGKTHNAREAARKIIFSQEDEKIYNELSDEQKKQIDIIIYGSQEADDIDEKLQKFKKYAGRIGFVQFHPSYDYTDFVEGLRPTKKKDTKEIGFELRDGVFRKFCDQANKDKDQNHKYIFIIDEINRADLSKVFGELMFGLEESYRDIPFKTQYSSLREDMRKNGENVNVEFIIPNNVYIISTMNDIDRSVESIDFALRRRFVWINVEANKVMKYTIRKMLEKKTKNNSGLAIDEVIEDLLGSAENLNKVIDENVSNFNLNENYHIGPAYFGKIDLTKEYKKAKEELWNIRIAPILFEYIRGYDTGLVKKFVDKCKDEFMKGKADKPANSQNTDNTDESVGEG